MGPKAESNMSPRKTPAKVLRWSLPGKVSPNQKRTTSQYGSLPYRPSDSRHRKQASQSLTL